VIILETRAARPKAQPEKKNPAEGAMQRDEDPPKCEARSRKSGAGWAQKRLKKA